MKRPCEVAKRPAMCKASKFNLDLCAQPRKPKTFSPPKVSELQKAAAKPSKAQPLPPDIAAKLDDLDLIIAIDIETHDWEVRIRHKAEAAREFQEFAVLLNAEIGIPGNSPFC